MERLLRRPGIAGLVLAAGIAAAAAQDVAPDRAQQERVQEGVQHNIPTGAPDIVREMKSPRIVRSRVDCDAAGAALGRIEALNPTGVVESAQRMPPPAPAELLARLNRGTGERFGHIAASPVPVLLPFDTAAFLRDRAAPAPEAASATANAPSYLSGFSAVPFFYPGPGGYDAL